jgi:hypothetical protein
LRGALHQTLLEVGGRVHLGRGQGERLAVQADHQPTTIAVGSVLLEARQLVTIEDFEGNEAGQLLELVGVLINR